jgi:hypothetical protein
MKHLFDWVVIYLQIVFVWQKNQAENISNTVPFLRSLTARQHVYLETVGKVISLWEQTFWSEHGFSIQ